MQVTDQRLGRSAHAWTTWLRRAAFALGVALLAVTALAQQPEIVGRVSPPNGTYSQESVDLEVHTSAGPVSWRRVHNGVGWRFNRHWDGISSSYKPLSSQAIGGGAPQGLVSGDAGGDLCGYWVWVDEDWTPTTEAAPIVDLTIPPDRYSRFNNQYPQDATPIINDPIIAASCGAAAAGSPSGGPQEFEGFRRLSSLYVGSNGTYVFKNRYTLRRTTISRLPAAPETGPGPVSNLNVDLRSAQTVANGWRWQDRAGEWVEYDDTGRIARYGDRNDNMVWLQRDGKGRLAYIIDGGNPAVTTTGRVVMTLHYNAGDYLVQVRDYPRDDNALDLPVRTVTYQYGALGRLVAVTDARGFETRFTYDNLNRLTSITDAESRTTRLNYLDVSTTVTSLTAADGSENTYSFSYDEAKKLFYSKLTGPATSGGRRVEDFTHDRAGDLVRYEVNGRTDLGIERDPVARSETQTNARGFTTVLTRNEFELVTRVVNPDGTTTSTEYESRYLNPVAVVDEGGFRTVMEYDGKGNLSRRIEAAGTPAERITEYEVDAYGRFTRVTRKGRTEANGTVTPDAVWQVQYDSTGQIRRVTDPEGHVRDYVFDRGGNLRQYTDPRANVTRYDVDAHGNLTRATNALGHRRSMAYDRVGNLTGFTDPRSKTTQAAYDAMNRRTAVTTPVNGTHRIEYNAQGLPISETDADGRVTRAQFDSFLRLVQQTDGLNNTTQMNYQLGNTGELGSLGGPTEVRYPTFTEQTRYDQRERPTIRTLVNPNAAGTQRLTSQTTYDSRGYVKTETDPNGKTARFSYDALGQLTESIDTLGHTTRAVYDARGNLIQLTDANGGIYRFEYDRNNRLTAEVLPLGQRRSYSYDPAGNLSERIDENGVRSVFTFDAANRLTELRHSRSTVLERITTFTWDDADNLTAWTDTDLTRPSGQQTLSGTATYDDADRKTSETVTYPNPAGGSGGTTTSLTYRWAFSAAGYKTKLTWPDGTEIDYGYSAHGELQTVTIPGEGTISVNQFKWTAPAQVTLPGGGVKQMSYDGVLNLESLKVRSPTQQQTLQLSNSYGNLLELLSAKRTDTVDGASSIYDREFSYDSEIRLTQSRTSRGGPAETRTYTLDALGNRTADSAQSGDWQYDANNRLIQRGSGSTLVRYEYDAAGNMTRRIEGGRTVEFRYDILNRLKEVADVTFNQNNLVARYGYDPLDRRLWREVYRDRAGQPLAQATRTIYLYADEGLMAQATQAITLQADGSVSASGAPALHTQYGPRPSTLSEDTRFTTGVVFVKSRAADGNDILAYLHYDHLDIPIQATDKSGVVVWSATYDAFGRASINTPSGTRSVIGLSLRLPGQVEDLETGLHYNWRRYYDPDTGQYITHDPIGLAGGLNPYLYAEADPINLFDPTGEAPPLLIAPAAKAAMGAYARCVARCTAVGAISGSVGNGAECVDLGDIAKDCSLGCLNPLNWLKGPGSNLRKRDYRERKKQQQLPPKNCADPEVHHDLPQTFEDEWRKRGIDHHDPNRTRWVPGSDHRGFSKQFNQLWREFLRSNPTNRQVENFRKKMSRDPRFKGC